MKGVSSNVDVLQKLRDDREYYGGVGKNYLSNSDIGTLLNNPKEFGIPREDNKNFLVGRYFHQLILEPEKAAETPIIDIKSRNAKAYKDFLFENNLDLALLEIEAQEALEWVGTIKGNMDFFEMIYHKDNRYEVPAIKDDMFGVPWKGKADIVGNDYVYDLKTTSDIQSFKWNARKYNYDSQAYIYEQLFGKPMMFLVIDKGSKMLGRFTMSDESLDRGKEKAMAAADVFKKFYGDNPTHDINQFYYVDTI